MPNTLALAAIAGNGSLGVTTSISDDFMESRSVVTPVNHKHLAKLLPSPVTADPTYGWTTNRAAASQLLLVEPESLAGYVPQAVLI